MAKEKLVGKITHYFTAIGVGIVKAKERIRLGDELHFKGATTDFYQEVGSIQSNYKSLKEARKGMEVGIKVKERVREGDGVYSAAKEAGRSSKRKVSQKSKAGGRGKKKSLSKKTKSGKIRKATKRKPKKAAKKIVRKKLAGKIAAKGKKKTARKTVRRTKVKKSAGRAVRKPRKQLRKSASKKGKKR